MKRFRYLLFLLLLTGCHPWYFDVFSAEVSAPEETGDIIPQEGTTLSLNLDYARDINTRTSVEEVFKVYRYRVFINDREYCQGMTASSFARKTTTIPIMANDTHIPATIVVEGSKALDYSEFPTSWDEWYELYRGTQECLSESEEPRYAGLVDAKLGVTVGNDTFTFDITDSGAGEVFKRMMMGQTLSFPVTINTCIRIGKNTEEGKSFCKQLENVLPANCSTELSERKVGGIYFNGAFDIYLDPRKRQGNVNNLGLVSDSDLKAFSALYPGDGESVSSTVTLFLK
jgi:hypothetical protein